jgi:hypothetical protein
MTGCGLVPSRIPSPGWRAVEHLPSGDQDVDRSAFVEWVLGISAAVSAPGFQEDGACGFGATSTSARRSAIARANCLHDCKIPSPEFEWHWLRQDRARAATLLADLARQHGHEPKRQHY